MSRWWEWDEGGRKVPELPGGGDFRYPFCIMLWVLGAGSMVVTVGALLFRVPALSTWALGIGVASLALAWLLWPRG